MYNKVLLIALMLIILLADLSMNLDNAYKVEAQEPTGHTIEWAGGYTAPFMTKPYNEEDVTPNRSSRLDHGNPQNVGVASKVPNFALYATIQHLNGDKYYYSYMNSGQACGDSLGNGNGGAIRSYLDPFGECRSYDGHSGDDYGMARGNRLLAVANGWGDKN